MPPRTIEELVQEANNYDFSPNVSFRSWVHVAKAILREADIYNMDGSLENAYILYERFAHLVINDLINHPDINAKNHKAQFSKLVKDVRSALEKMSKLNPVLKQQYEAYQQAQERSRILQAQAKQGKDRAQKTQLSSDPYRDEPYEAYKSFYKDSYKTEPSDEQFMAALSHLKNARTDVSVEMGTGPDQRRSSAQKWYPGTSNISVSQITPELQRTSFSSNPPVPPKDTDLNYGQPTTKETPSDSSIKHKVRSTTESGSPLRTVFLPESLRERFLAIAKPNTVKNLETCGILCGKLNRNAFFITHLVIPPQESTSDTCTTTDEIVLFDFIDTHELFVLGWIHTHPTQSCFLSSIDLHTQSSYQIMLPEAVAIVCAPKYDPSWGIFRLTDPPGVDVIKKCRQSLTFHPHPEENIYRLALPGHVSVKSQLTFEVRDLR